MEISCTVRILMTLSVVHKNNDIRLNTTVVYFCCRSGDKVKMAIRVKAFVHRQTFYFGKSQSGRR